MPREHEDWVRQLYLTHAPDLYRAARYRLQDPELAYDLTQEVLLTCWTSRPRSSTTPALPGGFGKPFSISWGTPFPARRSGPNTRPGRPTPDWLPAPLPATGGTLDEILPRQLPERDRQLLKMAYEEGLTYEEISRRLGIPPATCGTWLYRARQRCKHYLTLSEGGNPVEKT